MTFDEFFANIDNTPLVLVDFFHPQCGPCRQMPPLLKQFQEHTGVPTWKVDIMSNMQDAANMGITTVPTVVLYVNGNEAARHVGVPTVGKLESLVRPYV